MVPADVVARYGTRYHAPDITAVDQHLTGLWERVTRARQDGRQTLADALLGDIDLLLERRLFFMTVR